MEEILRGTIKAQNELIETLGETSKLKDQLIETHENTIKFLKNHINELDKIIEKYKQLVK